MEKKKRAAALLTHMPAWRNVELIKDCGLIPYLLQKKYDVEALIVGGAPEELLHFFGSRQNRISYSEIKTDPECLDAFRRIYPYSELVNGLDYVFLRGAGEEDFCSFIQEYGKDIDLLILRGAYESNWKVAQLYKEIRPQGCIYCGLDANSEWMDRILWYEDEFRKYMDCIDYAATSCTAMAECLSKKWPWKIHTVPNGSFYPGEDSPEKCTFEEKENVILTVGRLGTMQKSTHILIRAFCEILPLIPEWSLRLVGSVEERLKGEMEVLYGRYPFLREKIIFTGMISDRKVLRQEYEYAKIFALTSVVEGGTPNSVSDALAAGLAVATTKVDAYEDMTDHGQCGLASAIDDVKGFSAILLSLCTDPELKKRSEHAREYGNEFYNMEKIVGKLYGELAV